jgi:hypothetical protein
MRVSKQSPGVWTNEERSRQGSNIRELVAYLEAENAELRDEALKLASEIRALREAMEDVGIPSENTPPRSIGEKAESVVVH